MNEEAEAEDERMRDDNNSDGDEEQDENNRASQQLSDDQLVKTFVRYVLTCEHSRTVIRRDHVREKGETSEPPSLGAARAVGSTLTHASSRK